MLSIGAVTTSKHQSNEGASSSSSRRKRYQRVEPLSEKNSSSSSGSSSSSSSRHEKFSKKVAKENELKIWCGTLWQSSGVLCCMVLSDLLAQLGLRFN